MVPAPTPSSSHAASTPLWLHRYAVVAAALTALLVFAGGLVTSTDSGLSVPDWPLSFGSWSPPMVGGVVYEHGHRMFATFVGVLTVLLWLALLRWEPRRGVRRLGGFAVLAVLAQGTLGGLTVLLHLPTSVSVAHATLGQSFFCMMVTLALVTSPGWWAAGRRAVRTANDGHVLQLAVLLTSLVFAQLVLGAYMRHSGAGLAIPDFPLAFGRVVPAFTSSAVAVHYAHRVLGVIIAVVVAVTAFQVLRYHMDRTVLTSPAVLLVGLVMFQILLGGVAVWTAKAPFPTTLHVLNGALILATSLMLTLRSFRLLAPPPAQSRSLSPGYGTAA